MKKSIIKFGVIPVILLFGRTAFGNPYQFFFQDRASKNDASSAIHVHTRYSPKSEVRGQSAQLSWSKWDANFMQPLLHQDRNQWSIMMNAGYLSTERKNGDFRVLFPKTNVELPVAFKKFDLMGIFGHRFNDQRSIGATLGFGSASDRLFYDIDVTTIHSNFFYRLKASDASTWLFLINYSNNRSFLNNVPLPGVAYLYAPSKDLHLMLGMINSIRYRFASKWGFSFSLVPPWKVNTKLSYYIAGPIHVFIGFNWDIDSYLRAERMNSEERIYFIEKKMMLGVASPVSQKAFFNFSTGYAFGRQILESQSVLEKTNAVFDLTPNYFIDVSLAYRF